MQHAEIRDALLSADPPSEALLESIGQNSTQLDLLSAVARIYEHQGVIVNGCARQLCTSCDANAGCWREIRQSRPNAEPRREDRGIAFPFIGPGYRAGGVVTIAINFRRDSLDHGGRESGLHSGFKIAREQLSALDRGRKPRFAWDVSGVLALVLYSSRRAELPDPVGRDRRIEAVRATARLQAVKCSPLHQFVNRSKPSHAMEKKCPPRYLVKRSKRWRRASWSASAELPVRRLRALALRV